MGFKVTNLDFMIPPISKIIEVSNLVSFFCEKMGEHESVRIRILDESVRTARRCAEKWLTDRQEDTDIHSRKVTEQNIT